MTKFLTLFGCMAALAVPSVTAQTSLYWTSVMLQNGIAYQQDATSIRCRFSTINNYLAAQPTTTAQVSSADIAGITITGEDGVNIATGVEIVTLDGFTTMADYSGQKSISITCSSIPESGTYTLSLAEGALTLTDGTVNAAFSNTMNLIQAGDDVQISYSDVTAGEVTFTYPGNATYGTLFTVATTPTLVATVSGAPACTLVNPDGSETTSFAIAPMVKNGGIQCQVLNSGKFSEGTYTMKIPQGYFVLSNNDQNNAFEFSFDGVQKQYMNFTPQYESTFDNGVIHFTLSESFDDFANARGAYLLGPDGNRIDLVGDMNGFGSYINAPFPTLTAYGTYTFVLEKGSIYTTGQKWWNNQETCTFTIAAPIQYVDLDLEASFPFKDDNGYENYLRLSSTSQNFASIDYSGWAVKDADGNTYSNWAMAPAVNSNFTTLIDLRVPADLPVNAEYTMVIPEGSVTLTSGDKNNAAEVPFTYGTVGTPEPEAQSVSCWSQGINQNNGWYEWTVYTVPQLSRDGVTSDAVMTITVEGNDDYAATVTPRNIWNYSSYSYIYIPLPADLPSGTIQLNVPEGYFNIANSINYNAAFTRTTTWKNPNDPEPVIEKPLSAGVVAVKCLNEAGEMAWIDGNTATTEIESIRLSFGEYWLEKDRDLNKTISITDNQGNTKSAFISWSTDNSYNTAIDLEFYSNITDISEWTIEIPAGTFTWEDWNENKYTNTAFTLPNAFQLISAQKPQVEATEIEFDAESNWISFFNPTPNASLYAVLNVGSESDTYAYSEIIQEEGTDEGFFVERILQIRDNVPDGAPLYVTAYASLEGYEESVVTETYTLTVVPTFKQPVIYYDYPDDYDEATGTLSAGTTLSIINPNDGGVIRYDIGQGLQTAPVTHTRVTFTVPGNPGDDFTLFALIAPKAEEEGTWRASVPVEKIWTLTDYAVAVREFFAEGGDVEVYTLDGVRVNRENLTKGLYIIVRNGQVEKHNIR